MDGNAGGRKYVWFSALGVFFVLLLNVPLDLLLFDRQTELPFVMRGLWTPLVSLLAALLVNEMSRIARMHLRESEARARAVGAELDQAAIVQRALFPKDTQVVQGVSFAGSCVPSRSVGGDFFDWYPIEGGMAITLGDVMGKGVGAGMVAATARAVVRGSASFPDPVLAVHQLGRFIESELLDEPTFLTLFHGRLEVETGVLHYIDAGHGLTLLVRPDGSHDTLRSSDRPVGIIPGDTWVRHQVTVEPGDTVVSFSDGVLDLLGGHMSAVDEIARMTIAAPSASALSEAVATMARHQQNDDDVTIVVCRREPESALHGTQTAASEPPEGASQLCQRPGPEKGGSRPSTRARGPKVGALRRSGHS